MFDYYTMDYYNINIKENTICNNLLNKAIYYALSLQNQFKLCYNILKKQKTMKLTYKFQAIIITKFAST